MPPNPTPPATPIPTPPAGTTNDQFTAAIQSKLLDMSGMISSNNSDLETGLKTAQDTLQASSNKTDAATNLSYDQQIADAKDKASSDITNGRAGGAGGVLNLAALRELTDLTDKNLNDLEQKRQEALLNNDAATAKQLSDLQMQALTLKQDAIQKTFGNLLQLGQFGIQAQTEQRAAAAANDAHTKAVGDLIASNPDAGIKVTDTLDQAYAKMGSAPDNPDLQLKKAQIAKIYSDIKHANDKPVGTAADRQAAAITNFSTYAQPGATFAEKQPDGSVIPGKSVIDSSGYIVPTAFKQLIQQAPAAGLSRDQFLTEFGHLLYTDPKTGDVSPEYGLTPAEAKKITT